MEVIVQKVFQLRPSPPHTPQSISDILKDPTVSSHPWNAVLQELEYELKLERYILMTLCKKARKLIKVATKS